MKECGLIFRTKTNYTIHLKEVHGESLVDFEKNDVLYKPHYIGQLSIIFDQTMTELEEARIAKDYKTCYFNIGLLKEIALNMIESSNDSLNELKNLYDMYFLKA